MNCFFGSKKKKELEKICEQIDTNAENNYKDAAQEALKKLEEELVRLSLSVRQEKYYAEKVAGYRKKMEGFTHKDQKPYWTDK